MSGGSRGAQGLVLVPGLLCDRALFAPQVAALSRYLPIHVAEPEGATIAAMAENALAAVPFDRFALAGLSMGGMVAMHLANDERVTRLALLDTNHLADTDERRRERHALVDDARERGLEPVVREKLKPAYLAPMRRHDPRLNDIVVAMALGLGIEAFAEQTQALVSRRDMSGQLKRCGKPALVLCGAQDRPCPPERHDAMAALMPNAHRVTVPGAGHLTTLEAPAAVNAALLGWLFG